MAAVSVHVKLLDAQRSVDAVVKRGQNTEQRYSYATAADVIGVCRKALHDAGLYSAVTATKVTERQEFVTQKGTKGLHVEVRVTLWIRDPEAINNLKPNSPGAVAFEARGAGADYGGGDKAVLKAQTAATKYAYANALALPFADHDPEKDTGEPGRLPEQKADPKKALPEEKVEEIGKLLKDSSIGFDRLCLIFGSIGANAPKVKRKDSIRKAVAELTEAQATQLENVLASAVENPEPADG